MTNNAKSVVHQVGICGLEATVKPFSIYMGLERTSPKGIQYFEFPNNPKFEADVFRKRFVHNCGVYIAQQAMLNTIYFPKALSKLDLIIFVFDIADFSSFNTCYQYLKKIYTNSKYFPPCMLIGYLKAGKDRNDDGNNSFRSLMLRDELRNTFETECLYFEIEEDKNDAIFIRKFKMILDTIDPNQIYREESSIDVENKLKEFKESYLRILEINITLTEKLIEAYKIEDRKKTSISRPFLVENYGWNSKIAIEFINEWESKPKIQTQDPSPNINSEGEYQTDQQSQDSVNIIESDLPENKIIKISNTALERTKALRTDVNINSLIQLGYDADTAKRILFYLKGAGKIGSISYHRESLDYENFKNINYFIVLYNHQHYYSKSLDENACLLFSGLIQTIESIKDSFLKDANEYVPIKDRIIVEYLQFGEKFLVLVGNSKDGLKVIIRFRKKPMDQLYWEKKIKSFMVDYFNSVPLDMQTNGQGFFKELRKKSEIIFYRHFNPFHSNLDNLKPLSLLKEIDSLDKFSMREAIVLRFIKNNRNDPNKVLIENVINAVSEQSNNDISRSDIILVIADLIKEKYIGQQ